jgi:hypothetical protein
VVANTHDMIDPRKLPINLGTSSAQIKCVRSHLEIADFHVAMRACANRHVQIQVVIVAACEMDAFRVSLLE